MLRFALSMPSGNNDSQIDYEQHVYQVTRCPVGLLVFDKDMFSI